MINYILQFLGISVQSGSIEYYLVLSISLQVFLCCACALVRYLTAPVDLLSRPSNKR